MNTTESYVQHIKRIYPDLTIETTRLNHEGQYNDVLIVNDTLIFRFAKYAAAVETLKQETIILNSIQDYITLAIPQPIYQNLTTQTAGEVFMGYRMIPGEPLWYDRFVKIDNDTVLEMIATSLVTFLHELHSISVDQVISIDLPVADQPGEWVDLYTRIQAKLFPFMRAEMRDRVSHHFETYLNQPQLYQFEPVLRHGDFGTGNIIFDPKTHIIIGVIDFGSATRGDPAIDFAGLAGFGESFFNRCGQIYPEIEEMLERIHFYQGTFALQEALFGIEHNDPEAFTSGIASYL